MDTPLQQVAAAGDRDHDPGPCFGSDLSPHVLAECRSTALRQIEKEFAAPPEQRTQEPWHGQNEVTMRDWLEHLFAQPFGPEEGALLLAGGTERTSATRVGDQVAQATRLTPSVGVPVLDEPTCKEGPQDPLDDRTQRAVHLGEALLVNT